MKMTALRTCASRAGALGIGMWLWSCLAALLLPLEGRTAEDAVSLRDIMRVWQRREERIETWQMQHRSWSFLFGDHAQTNCYFGVEKYRRQAFYSELWRVEGEWKGVGRSKMTALKVMTLNGKTGSLYYPARKYAMVGAPPNMMLFPPIPGFYCVTLLWPTRVFGLLLPAIESPDYPLIEHLRRENDRPTSSKAGMEVCIARESNGLIQVVIRSAATHQAYDRAWLDPKHDLFPVYWESTGDGGGLIDMLQADGFVMAAPDVHVPFCVRNWAYTGDPASVCTSYSEMIVDEVKANQPIAEAEFALKLPSGVKVMDRRGGQIRVAGETE